MTSSSKVCSVASISKGLPDGSDELRQRGQVIPAFQEKRSPLGEASRATGELGEAFRADLHAAERIAERGVEAAGDEEQIGRERGDRRLDEAFERVDVRVVA